MEYYNRYELVNISAHNIDVDIKKIQLSVLKHLGSKVGKEKKEQSCDLTMFICNHFCLVKEKHCQTSVDCRDKDKRNQEALRLFKQLSNAQMEFEF